MQTSNPSSPLTPRRLSTSLTSSLLSLSLSLSLYQRFGKPKASPKLLASSFTSFSLTHSDAPLIPTSPRSQFTVLTSIVLMAILFYEHYEDPTPAQAATRQCQDMQGNKYHCSGYRLLHWLPSLRTSTHMFSSSRNTVLQVAAAISCYTARNIRLDSESSKLLILAPHKTPFQI